MPVRYLSATGKSQPIQVGDRLVPVEGVLDSELDPLEIHAFEGQVRLGTLYKKQEKDPEPAQDKSKKKEPPPPQPPAEDKKT